MDRQQKLVIVVLVAIVVVFVITVGVGARGDGGGSSDDKDPVEFLEGLRSERYLLLDQGGIGTTCQNPTGSQVTVAQPCTISVSEPGRFSRPANVVLRSNAPVNVRLEPERGPTLEETVQPGECVQTSLAGGGTIRFQPVSGNAAVTFHNANCPEE